MNIAKLLLDEMYRVARQISVEKYNDPTAKDITLSLDDIIKVNVCKKNRPALFNSDAMIFDSYEGSYSERMEANSFYSRVAALLEYNELRITLDNTIAYILAEKEKTGKLPLKYRSMWKYYIPLSKSVLTKEEKQDCMRYALLRTIDENDQIMTFGIIWRPDVSISKSYNSRLNYLTREERNAEKYRIQQLSRDNSESWTVEDGKVRSSYILAFSGNES